MVDRSDRDGKNPDTMNRWMPVVAGAMHTADGRWLMHRRSLKKHHGGLWEFPGGKVEASEKPIESLVRELHEELGVRIREKDCSPNAFAEERPADGRKPIVILLYRIDSWEGEPVALEGEEIGWFLPNEIHRLDKPPLDVELALRLFGKG